MFGTINLESYFSEVADLGWAVLPVDLNFAHLLKQELLQKKEQNQFSAAGLARSVSEPNIRNDFTCWIDENNASASERKLLQEMARVTEQLKFYFRIGLTHFEAHYALFPKGHFYHKHTDQKNEDNHRFFSFVIYLNDNWKPADGGRLLVYNQENLIFSMAPELGKMILFRSDIVHEVETSLTDRLSITGWIRTS